MGELSDEEVLRQFEGYAHVMRLVLGKYDHVPDHVQNVYSDIQSPRERFFWLLTLDNGIRNIRANLEWAESVIERIHRHEIPAKKE
jgi:hypothetical protein